MSYQYRMVTPFFWAAVLAVALSGLFARSGAAGGRAGHIRPSRG